MGYIRHHAIVLTSWDWTAAKAAHSEAVAILGEQSVSPIQTTETNGYHSFFIGPDGSKEGWEESDAGDKRRDAFVAYLNSQRYEDGSSSLKWAVVQYGDDERQSLIVDHTDAEHYRQSE